LIFQLNPFANVDEFEAHRLRNCMTSQERIRIIIVDDHAVVRGGLSFFLIPMPDIEVVGEAADGERALRLCWRLQPDVVLMDLVMPGMDGIECTNQIRQTCPKIKVIVLTSFQEEDLVGRALQAGANGYLLKDASAKDVADAIRAVYAGRSVLAPGVTEALIHAVTQPPKLGHDLTERELEFLDHMAKGLSNVKIAGKMLISRNTVRHHVHGVLSKLNAANRTEAVSLAVTCGLVPGSRSS
jgi:NarL family two-component system response regulator LiaR